MPNVRERLHRALEIVPVVDVHCHLRPHRPAADTLADIVLYHHVWIELVSSGMPQRELGRMGLPQELVDSEVPAIERVRRALRYLPNLENTTSGLMLRWLLRDLYELDGLTEANLEWLSAAVAARAGDPLWREEVLRQRCHIESSITVERGGAPCSPSVALGAERLPLNLQDGKRTPRQVLSDMDASLGREVRTVADYRELVAGLVRGWQSEGVKMICIWPLPYLSPEGSSEDEVSRTLQRAREGDHLSSEELGGFAYFALTQALESLRRDGPRIVQLIAGAEVLTPHRSIAHWSHGYTNAVARLANAYEDFHFSLSTASDVYTQDLGVLAKHLPNVSVAGYWWHTFYPRYIRKSLETRLDMVPANKIVGFFSDAYHAEWCYPKLKLVKQVVEDILVERVERGWYSLALALRLVEQLFHENASAIYRV